MGAHLDSPATEGLGDPDSPYIGLSYYTEDLADVFFGREAERNLIIGNLRAARLTVLYARSGVGKSSLLRAGVAARLREAAKRRIGEERRAGTYIPVVFSSWRDEPMDELIEAVEQAVASYAGDRAGELPRESLEAALDEAASRTGTTLLVILDQFEEYFLYGPSERQPGRFADELARCLNRPDLPVNFLIAVREDAYAGIGDLLRGKVANPYANSLNLDYMDRAAAREAIVKPVEYFNSRHPGAEAIQLEPELVEAVLEQVRTGQVSFDEQAVGALEFDGAGPREERIETPYLQLVLLALWERERRSGSTVLRKSTLDDLGGATAIVRSHLDRAMSLLSDDERETAVEVFNHLVTPSGTKIVHSVADLAQYSGREPAQIQALVEKLSGDERILRPVPPVPGERWPRVEIFHDVLAPAIISWRTGQNAARLEREREAAERRAGAERRRARNFRALAAVSLVLLAVAAVAAILAQAETNRAHSAEHLALSRQLAQQASSDLQGGALSRGVLLALEAYRLSHTDAARLSLVRALTATAPMVAYLGGHTGNVTSVAYSPDGKLLASGGADGTVVVQDLSTGRTLRTLHGSRASVQAVSFSRDGMLLFAGGLDGLLRVWSVATGRLVKLVPANQPIYGLTFNPRGTMLAAGGRQGTVTLYDPMTGQATRTLGSPGPAVLGMAFGPDGRTLAVAAGSQVVLWNAATGARVRTMDGHQGTVNNVAFSPSGVTVASAGAKQSVVIWNARSGHRRLTLHGHSGPVNGLAFSPDGRLLASGGNDHKVILWSASTGARLQTLQGHSASVEAVAFSPNGRTLASGGDDDQVIVWSSSPPLLGQTLAVGSQVLAVAASPDGTRLATGGLDGTVQEWDGRTGRRLSILRGQGGPVQSVAYSPDGRTVASGSTDQTVILWNAATGVRERTLIGHGNAVYSVAFSPDGRTLASGSADQTVILWNAATGARERILHGHNDFVFAVAFSANSRTLASGSADRTVILWDVASGRRLRTLVGHTGAVESVAFSPSGRVLASAGNDGQVILWDPTAGRRLGGPLWTGSSSVLGLAFDPSRPILASGGTDQDVTLWDLNTRLGFPVYGHTGPVQGIAFALRGSTVASASLDTSVQEDGPVPSQIDLALVSRRLCGVVRRNLQVSERDEYLPGQPYHATCPGYPAP